MRKVSELRPLRVKTAEKVFKRNKFIGKLRQI